MESPDEADEGAAPEGIHLLSIQLVFTSQVYLSTAM
jgi:hypothetical protein